MTIQGVEVLKVDEFKYLWSEYTRGQAGWMEM